LFVQMYGTKKERTEEVGEGGGEEGQQGSAEGDLGSMRQYPPPSTRLLDFANVESRMRNFASQRAPSLKMKSMTQPNPDPSAPYPGPAGDFAAYPTDPMLNASAPDHPDLSAEPPPPSYNDAVKM